MVLCDYLSYALRLRYSDKSTVVFPLNHKLGNKVFFMMPLVISFFFNFRKSLWGFPGVTVVKNPPANSGDMGSSPGPGRSHMPQSY